MRSSLTDTRSSEPLAPTGRVRHYVWATDARLAEAVLAELRPASGLLAPLPTGDARGAALADVEARVLVVAAEPGDLPAAELEALIARGARCVLLLERCDDHGRRRWLDAGVVDVLTAPFTGADLTQLFADREPALPLDRRLPDLDARVRTQCEFSIPAELRYVAPAAGFLCRLAREHGFHPSVWRENLPLALDEAISNAVRHGCGEDAELCVEIRARLAHDVFMIRIADEGPGFDPDALADPVSEEGLHRGGGRGVLLMRELMDRVEFLEGGRVTVLYARRGAGD